MIESKSNKIDDIYWVLIWFCWFAVFSYRGLKNKIICSWINDDSKYKKMMTPKDGREVRMIFPHPIRLTIEAGWVFGYFVLFGAGIIYSIIGHLFGWGFIQRIFFIFFIEFCFSISFRC